jgi:hypothetical protein
MSFLHYLRDTKTRKDHHTNNWSLLPRLTMKRMGEEVRVKTQVMIIRTHNSRMCKPLSLSKLKLIKCGAGLASKGFGILHLMCSRLTELDLTELDLQFNLLEGTEPLRTDNVEPPAIGVTSNKYVFHKPCTRNFKFSLPEEVLAEAHKGARPATSQESLHCQGQCNSTTPFSPLMECAS